ncbi:MAG TPA: type II secretion system secretin GspD [Kiritimatiellia bacterium]|nr:type II secretion system secretin GspD [Kiritimatiellia bacterium]
MSGLTWLLIVALFTGPVASVSAATPTVHFNFDQADIRLIVKMVGEVTGRRFVLDDSVTGRVSVVTPEQVPVDQAYSLLVSILESTGFTVVEREDGTYILPLRVERALSGGRVVLSDEPLEGEGLITRVMAIRHVNAIELAKLLEPLVRGGATGAITAFPGTNHLILTETAQSLRQLERIIADLDQPGASRTSEIIRLEHASAEDTARQLITALQGMTTSGDQVTRHVQRVVGGLGSLPSDVVIVPVPHANSIVVVASTLQLQDVKRIVREIDVPTPADFGRLNAIFLKYLLAEEAAGTLNKLLEKSASREPGGGRIAIEHNAANNALIVDAAPQDFELIRQLVDELDQIPEQVMVEVLIAEVSTGDSFDLGFELATIDQPVSGDTTALGRSRPGADDTLGRFLSDGTTPQGLVVGVARGVFNDGEGGVIPRVPILLRALAKDRDVKILSNIPLWAQNNTEASVSVVENIPILSSRIEGIGDNRDVIQNIERVDVGIKLRLTPHVNPQREVKLRLNPSIETIIDQGPPNAQFAPTIAKREVSTTVTIPDRSTVVISGLIREDQIEEVSKVPLLGDLPLIGWLFRSKSQRSQRTNLLIFVTPHIVTRLDDAEQLRDMLRDKTGVVIDPVALPAMESASP